jgi:predicted Zn finger-like uncharacterized protein
MRPPLSDHLDTILARNEGIPSMDVTCPACAARYTADEQKLRGKTARMRCKACDTVWLVSGPEDKMIEEKRAAVVKRGADRDHRDLFASRPADLGSVKQTLRPPVPADLGSVAARNETSVLFTVDSLKGAARVKTPEPQPAPLSSAFVAQDDEGVIDLKALASTPPRAHARSVAPLFSEPPPAAFSADVDGSGMSQGLSMPGGFKLGKRAFAGIAAAAVALVLCSVGLAAAFKGEEPVARSAANSIMAPVAPPAATSLAAPPSAPVIAPVTASNASASSDDDTKAPVSGKGKGKKGKGAKASFAGKSQSVQSSGVSSKKASSSDALVSKPAVKAADKCGCKGDFNCILRCTAKGS